MVSFIENNDAGLVFKTTENSIDRQDDDALVEGVASGADAPADITGDYDTDSRLTDVLAHSILQLRSETREAIAEAVLGCERGVLERQRAEIERLHELHFEMLQMDRELLKQLRATQADVAKRGEEIAELRGKIDVLSRGVSLDRDTPLRLWKP
jgi:hypothetical protein